jgi:hypothetical protein
MGVRALPLGVAAKRSVHYIWYYFGPSGVRALLNRKQLEILSLKGFVDLFRQRPEGVVERLTR